MGLFRIPKEFHLMIASPYKTGMSRLPFRAAAFVALVCVAILGMSGWGEWSARDADMKGAEVELANLARSLTQHAEDSFDILDNSITGTVSRLETEGTDRDTLTKLRALLLLRKAASKRIHAIFVCDENGDWLTSSGVMGANLGDREDFQHHKQSAAHDVFISYPLKSEIDGEWIITVSRRFNHPDGSFAGVVFADVSSRYFSEFYRQFNIGADGAVALVSTDGVVMTRSPDDGSYVGRDVSGGPFFVAFRSGGSSGVQYFKSFLDGLQRLGAYQRSSRYPFVALATKAQDEVLAPWRRAAIVRVLFVLSLVALIAFMGLYLVRQLLQGQRMAAALAAKEANFRVLAEGSSDMVTRIGLDERVQYASPSSVRIVGWRPDQLVGKPALAGVNPEDLPRVEKLVAALKRGETEEARITYRTRHRERSEIWVESTLRITRKVGGEIDGVVAISRDMTQQKDTEGRLATLAIEDGLTGLANRRHFDERLEEEWARAFRERTCLSLLMIDLDHFKKYNDAYGHPAGDECLRVVARIMAAEAMRVPDVAARYGGEEFAMLLPNTDAAGCARIGERIRCAIRQAGIPHALNLPSGRVTASFGGAICQPASERSSGCASLVEAADRALYAAKGGGRDRLVMATQTLRLVTSAAS
jgi:diguanylate cyclase (GGDEF)-like protein/PAS domain S-box-containing protein